MKNILRKLVLFLTLLLILALTVAEMQSSIGKIRGKIIDKQSGEPLIGAEITIPGTTIGASTDASGEYVILVPFGIYSLKASYIGYSTMTLNNIKVTPDAARIINIQLNSVDRSPASEYYPVEPLPEKKSEMPPIYNNKTQSQTTHPNKAAKPQSEGQTSIEKIDGGNDTQNDIPSMIEAELKKLSVGKMLYNIPEEMKAGIKERVVVRIASSVTTDLEQGVKGKGKPVEEQIKVGSLMTVKLHGDNFEIKPITNEEQVVTKTGFTEWSWDVLPLKSGKQNLSLVVSVRLKIPNFGEEKKDYPVFDKQINVKVNFLYTAMLFLKNNWQFFAGPLFTGIVGFYLKGWLEAKKKLPRKSKH
jgi:hypothetical protein